MKYLLLIILATYVCTYDFRNGISRFNMNKVILDRLTNLGSEYKEFNVDMRKDHFSFENKETFPLRYLVKDDYFNKKDPKAPILFYCGNEGPIDAFYNNSGFITENLAKEFRALVIFAEHRFFGTSLPTGVQDYDITKNKLLSVEQAMADFIELLRIYKQQNGLENNPVIAFGGSYGGMLAAWSRMKFPHVYLGAIASSAPILLFEDINRIQNNFFKIVTNTYKRYDAYCTTLIKKGFDTIDKIKANPLADDYTLINSIFNPCTPASKPEDIQNLEDLLEDVIVTLAQYNYPYETEFMGKLPAEPVKVACQQIKFVFEQTNNKSFLEEVFDEIFGDDDPKTNLTYLQKVANVLLNNPKCLDTNPIPKTPNGWSYLACTEMIMPFQKDGLTDMFSPSAWNLDQKTKDCKDLWKADVRPFWAFDYFGGRNFAKETTSYTNIVYTNGEMDPWNAGCPQESNNSSVVIVNADAAHHLDLRAPHPKDPPSILRAREVVKQNMRKWLLK
jgi:lysosomal Pro-X carboxypeptidase